LDLALNRQSVLLLPEYSVRKLQVCVDTLVSAHLQPAEHDRDQPGQSASLLMSIHRSDSPASACPADHVKVVARLWRRVRVDGLHELLEDHQRRQAADAAAVEGQQPDAVVQHHRFDQAAIRCWEE